MLLNRKLKHGDASSRVVSRLAVFFYNSKSEFNEMSIQKNKEIIKFIFLFGSDNKLNNQNTNSNPT